MQTKTYVKKCISNNNFLQIKAAIFFGGFYDMKTVKATEFPRIQLFMKSYTGMNNWKQISRIYLKCQRLIK